MWDRGHTEAWDVKGPIATLSGRVTHDDWKPTAQWLSGQARYMQRELGSLHAGRGGLVRWLRLRPPLMPIVVFIYCLFGKGLIFSGRAGMFYALQRMVAEAVLSLMVLEAKLRERVVLLRRTALTETDQRFRAHCRDVCPASFLEPIHGSRWV